MRKRLALGRILLGTASLVLLDEPYAALDAEGMDLIDALLPAWREIGVTVIVASHSTDRLGPLLDARVLLDRGLVGDVVGEGVSSAPPLPRPVPRPAIIGSAR